MNAPYPTPGRSGQRATEPSGDCETCGEPTGEGDFGHYRLCRACYRAESRGLPVANVDLVPCKDCHAPMPRKQKGAMQICQPCTTKRWKARAGGRPPEP